MNKVEIYWHDDEKTILRQVFHSGVTSEEVVERIAYGRSLLDAISYKVTLLSEIRQPFVLPKGYLHIIRTTSPKIRPNEVLHVVVGSPILIRSVVQIASRMHIPNLRYVQIADTVEQGLVLCQKALGKTASLTECG